jgi:hypothetical protein
MTGWIHLGVMDRSQRSFVTPAKRTTAKGDDNATSSTLMHYSCTRGYETFDASNRRYAGNRHRKVAGMARASACLAVGLALAALLLSGCGGKDRYDLPEYDPSAASAPSASSAPLVTGFTPTPHERLATPTAAVRYRPADALGQGAWVERGRVAAGAAGSAPKKAALAAVQKYLTVRVQLSNTWVVDEPALAATASGSAAASARRRAAFQKERKLRSTGRFVLNVSSVRLDGAGKDRATVTGCDFDATSEVDAAGNVVVPPPGGVLITMKVRRTGGIWRVTDWPEGPVPDCDWRR